MTEEENDKGVLPGEQKESGNNQVNKEAETNDLNPLFKAWNQMVNSKFRDAFRKFTVVLISFFTILLLFILFIYIIPGLSEIAPLKKKELTNSSDLKKEAAYKKQTGIITRDIQRLSRKYNGYTSGQSYIVINTTYNRFSLFRNKKMVREGFCSSGSYTLLQSHGTKSWIFKTPKGKYWIQGKTKYPVWKKPDWAFVEEGLPIPPINDPSRFEYGVLGDYAMSIGDGYLIHGTIYKRFLGMPVTHGCVRLNDEDLEYIFNTLNIGSKVYIF
jgi:hypothetical protein